MLHVSQIHAGLPASEHKLFIFALMLKLKQNAEGNTWNHPVLVGNVLLVRNGQEMAAFRLSLAGR